MAIGFVSSVKIGFVQLKVELFILCLFVAMTVLAFWWPLAIVVTIAYLALLAHEIAHATVYRIALGVGSTITLSKIMSGHTASLLPRQPTVREQIAFHLAGPLTGIACGVALLVVSGVAGLSWPFLVGGCLIVLQHGINLMPLKSGSDGERLRELFRA